MVIYELYVPKPIWKRECSHILFLSMFPGYYNICKKTDDCTLKGCWKLEIKSGSSAQSRWCYWHTLLWGTYCLPVFLRTLIAFRFIVLLRHIHIKRVNSWEMCMPGKKDIQLLVNLISSMCQLRTSVILKIILFNFC